MHKGEGFCISLCTLTCKMIFLFSDSLVNAFHPLSIHYLAISFNINNLCVFLRRSECKPVCLYVFCDWWSAFFFFFFSLSPSFGQAGRVRRKACEPPNHPNRAQWIGLTFCPLPLQTHPQVGAQRSTLSRWKTGGTRLHRHKDTDILTGAHTLYLNTNSCLFACFSHSLRACAPRVFYLLALDSCQTLIEGWHEYLAHVFFFFFLCFN